MKILFIDVDGTLIDNNGMVPESAKNAIIQARKNGHLVFINTGRSRAQVFKYIEEIGFDGFICSDGNYVEYKGQIIKKESLNHHQIDVINAFLKKNNLGFMAEGHNDFLVNDLYVQKTHELKLERFEKVFPFSGIVDEVPYDGMGKINFPSKTDISGELRKDFGDEFAISYFNSDISPEGMMSLALPGSDKMNGIDFLVEYLKLDDVETYAFGDTMGDFGMIKGCTYGICVGNGTQALKDKSDYVTDSVSNDGLAKAFEHFGLI